MIELAPSAPAPADHVGEGYVIRLVAAGPQPYGQCHPSGLYVERRWPRFTTITLSALEYGQELAGVIVVCTGDANGLPRCIHFAVRNGTAYYRVAGYDAERRAVVCEFVEGEYREVPM